MAKFIVQSLARGGFSDYGRGGRRWPSSAPTEIEVVADEEDPPHDPAKGIRMGQKNFAAIQADPMLRVAPSGDPQAVARMLDSVPQLQAEVARLQAENASLRAALEQRGGAAAAVESSEPKGRSGGRKAAE